MKHTLRTLLLVAGCMLACSCQFRLADFTFASSKNVDMKSKSGFTTMPNARTSATDTQHLVIFFPINSCSPKEAIDKAIEKNGSDCVGLSNVVLESGWWYIPYVYGQAWYKVTGDPVFKR